MKQTGTYSQRREILRIYNKLSRLIEDEPLLFGYKMMCSIEQGCEIVLYRLVPRRGVFEADYWASVSILFKDGQLEAYHISVNPRVAHADAVKEMLRCDFELALEDINGYPQSNK